VHKFEEAFDWQEFTRVLAKRDEHALLSASIGTGSL